MKKTRKLRQKSILKHPYIQKETTNIIVKNKIHGINYLPHWQIIQSGGGIVESEGYTFLYEKNNDVHICVANKPYTGLCFKIEFNKSIKTILLDIGYSPGCSSNKELPKSVGTLAMLKAIMKIIFSHKDIQKYTSIQLSDTSSVPCKSFMDGREYMIDLSNMYFICTGCTWYSTLAPMFLLSKYEEKTYTQDKTTILNPEFTWNTLLSKLPKETESALTNIIEFESPNRANEPAYRIFNAIKDVKQHCIIFKMFMDDFLKTFKVSSMKGKVWCIPLKNGRIVGCKDIDCYSYEKGIVSEFIDWVHIDEYNSIKKSLQTDDIPMNIRVEKINFVY